MTSETTTEGRVETGATDRTDQRGTEPNRVVDGSTRRGSHSDRSYYVLGDGPLAAAIAASLRACDASVTVTVTVADATADDRDRNLERGLPDSAALEQAGVGADTTAIIATGSDARNLLLAQRVRTHHDVDGVVVLVNSPDRIEPFAAAGHTPVCTTSALSNAVVDAV